MNKHERGEIATIITIGTLVVIGVTTLVSSFFINQKKTTSSKAAEACVERPNIQPPPPAEKEWVADCSKVCSSNSDCPFGIGSEDWSRWCYGFSGGSRCMKQVFKSGGSSPPPAGGGSVPPGGGGGVSGCFHLDAGVDKIGTNKFNVSIKFVSDGGDGDIQLERDGAHVAGWNGWNRGVNNPYVYGPEWTGGAIEVSSGTKTVNYKGYVANSAACPGVNATLTCTFSSNGSYSCGGASANPPAPPAGTNPPPAGTNPPPAGTNPPPAGTNPPPAGTNPPPTGNACNRAGYICVEKESRQQTGAWNCDKGGYTTYHTQSCDSTSSVCCSGIKTGSNPPASPSSRCGYSTTQTKSCTAYIDGAEGRTCPDNEKPISGKSMYMSLQNGFFTDSLCTSSNHINDPVDYCCEPISGTNPPPAGTNPPPAGTNPPPAGTNPPAGSARANCINSSTIHATFPSKSDCINKWEFLGGVGSSPSTACSSAIPSEVTVSCKENFECKNEGNLGARCIEKPAPPVIAPDQCLQKTCQEACNTINKQEPTNPNKLIWQKRDRWFVSQEACASPVGASLVSPFRDWCTCGAENPDEVCKRTTGISSSFCQDTLSGCLTEAFVKNTNYLCSQFLLIKNYCCVPRKSLSFAVHNTCNADAQLLILDVAYRTVFRGETLELNYWDVDKLTVSLKKNGGSVWTNYTVTAGNRNVIEFGGSVCN